jgi:hypothetical protein
MRFIYSPCRIFAVCATCCATALIAPAARGITLYESARTLGVETSDVWLGFNSPSTPFTVTANAGTHVTGSIDAFNRVTLNMSAGVVTGGVYGDGFSHVNLSGGAIGGQIQSIGSCLLSMSGGTVGTDASAFDTSTLEITGGSIARNLFVVGSSIVNLRGGSIGSLTYLRESGTLNIYGNNLTIASLTHPQPGRTVYMLAGSLIDGTNITGMTIWHDTINNATGSLHLYNVPGPSTGVVVGIGGVMMARRRRVA